MELSSFNLLEKAVANIGAFIQVSKALFDESEMNELDETFQEIVKGFCMVDIEQKELIDSLEKTKRYYEDKRNDSELPIEACFKNIHGSTDNQDELIPNHPLWEKYCGNFTERIANDGNEDVMEIEGFQPPADPITKLIIRNPVRNQLCGHVYDKSSLVNIKGTCPFFGCKSNKVTSSNLVDDKELKLKIDTYFSRK